MLSLTEDIYRKSKSVVKTNGKLTKFFDLTKRVRQGCPISPLLFNLYVNDIFTIIDNCSDNPLNIKEGVNINAIMYADDLVLLSNSEEGLQKKLDKLTE